MNCIITLCFNIMCWTCAVSVQLTNKWTRYTDLDGFLATSGTVVVARSRAHCGRLCAYGCQSLFYIVGGVEPNCQLHDEVFLTSWGMATGLNASYYIPENYSVPLPPFPNDELYHTTLLSDGSLFTFKYHNQNQAYAVAVEECVKESGRLVRITTAAKFDMLRTILGSPAYTTSTQVYVDGFNEAGVWYFNNNDIAAFPVLFWAPLEPRNIISKSFYCTRLGDSVTWYAENWSCLDQRPFICER